MTNNTVSQSRSGQNGRWRVCAKKSGIGYVIGMGLRWAAMEGGEFALKKVVSTSVNSIVSQVLDSFKLVDNINDKLGEILGDLEPMVVQAKNNKARIDIIKKNGFQIFKNILERKKQQLILKAC